jgi:putative transposase
VKAGLEVRAVCARVGMSRQNYYVVRRARARREVDEELVLALVLAERRQQPRLGTRKLRHLLKGRLEEAGVRIGRDRFFEVLRRASLLVVVKALTRRTTQSRHSLPVFGNRVKGLVLSGPNQVWVADLTYIRTEDGFAFAAVIMDAWSRKLVGTHLGDNLESIGCQSALILALEGLPVGQHPIHHSDRGCQYCCHDYVRLLRGAGMQVSMTQELHCYENAQAERVIGILKGEYELNRNFKTKAQAQLAFAQATQMYNQFRPHLKLNFQVPAVVHGQG